MSLLGDFHPKIVPNCRDAAEADMPARMLVANHRARVRAALYMGALVASRWNSVLRAFYQRLLAAGKPKKVALTVCLRKLLTILNSMMRSGEPWSPTFATS